MEYRKLGQTGLKVSRLCLGTAFRSQPEDKICNHMIHRALDGGINFIDCANAQGQDRSENLVGKALKGRREDIVLATKVWSPVGQGPNDRGLSRFHIMREAERSLQRLRSDHIDLYWMHNFDADTPVEETLRALDDLLRQGKVRYVGAANFSGWQLVESLWTSQRLNQGGIVCLQHLYNLLRLRAMEDEILVLARRYDLGVVTYSPLAAGLLSGRWQRDQSAQPEESAKGRRLQEFDKNTAARAEAVVRVLVEIGQEYGKSPAQVALAWVLDHAEVTASVIELDGVEELEEALGGLELSLSQEQRLALDQVSRNR